MGNVTTIEARQKRKVEAPAVIEAAGREVISTHRFNLDRVADKMIRDGINGWVNIQDLAKFVYGNARQCNIQAVRRRYHALRTTLLGRGHLLIKEPGQRPWLSCKLYVGGSEIERQAAVAYFDETSKKLSHERFEAARGIFEKTNALREMEKGA